MRQRITDMVDHGVSTIDKEGEDTNTATNKTMLPPRPSIRFSCDTPASTASSTESKDSFCSSSSAATHAVVEKAHHDTPPSDKSVGATRTNSIHAYAPPNVQHAPLPVEPLTDISEIDAADEMDMPDREELRDQLEWDLGVAETLFRFKQWQIEEQINIDLRSRRNSSRKSLKRHGKPYYRRKLWTWLGFQKSAPTHNGERRKSCMDHMRASQACGFASLEFTQKNDQHHRQSTNDGGTQPRRSSTLTRPKFLSAEYKLAEEMRSKSQRALFEGLANTAEMSRDRWYILQPNSTPRHVWANIVAFATTVTAILSPLLACRVLDASNAYTDAVEGLVDAIFLLDLVIQSFTAYQDQERDIVVTSPKHIRLRYLKGWFAMDALAALPVDWFLRHQINETTGSSGTSAWRLLKILRAYHLFSENDVHINLGDTAVNPAIVSLFKLTMMLTLFWHVTACLYSLLSLSTLYALQVDPDPTDQVLDILSSRVLQLLGRSQYLMQGGHDQNLTVTAITNASTNAATTGEDAPSFVTGMIIEFDENVWHMPEEVWVYGPFARYLYAMSWAIAVTCQTTRPVPNNFLQLIMSDVVMVSGLFLMTIIIGAATAAIAEMQAQRSETTRLLQRIAQYMRNKRLPRDLRRRVLSFYQFHQSSMNILENEDVLVGLPRAMRMQINLLMHKPVFVKLPLFWLCTEEEMLLIVQRLRPCLIMPGEMMLKEGTIGAGLFLLMKGAVETTSNRELLVVLLAVAAFGEAALQSEEASTVTIRALRFCETSLLVRDDWMVIERLNPRIRTWLDIYINERDRKIRDPKVKNQSQQTKNATIRCGNNGYREWNEVTNTKPAAKSHLHLKGRALGRVIGITRQWRGWNEEESASSALRRRSADLLNSVKHRSMSICAALNALALSNESSWKSNNDAMDSVGQTPTPSPLKQYASTRKLNTDVIEENSPSTPRDELRNSEYTCPILPGVMPSKQKKNQLE